MADFANDLADVLNTVADKVKEYGGYAKLQALIAAEEAKKQDAYYRLGKKYYELYKDAPASDLTEITDKLVASDEKIEELKAKIKDLQAAGYTDVADEEECDSETADCEEVDKASDCATDEVEE